jgi:hypothetical protein
MFEIYLYFSGSLCFIFRICSMKRVKRDWNNLLLLRIERKRCNRPTRIKAISVTVTTPYKIRVKFLTFRENVHKDSQKATVSILCAQFMHFCKIMHRNNWTSCLCFTVFYVIAVWPIWNAWRTAYLSWNIFSRTRQTRSRG